MASSLRVNDNLYHDAEACGLLLHRSAAKQVEFWAELGKHVDRFVTANDLVALMQGIAKIHVEIPKAAAIDPMSVFDTVDQLRSSGQLGQTITHNAPYYEASIKNPGLLDQVMPDGSRKTGRFNNGEFTIE